MSRLRNVMETEQQRQMDVPDVVRLSKREHVCDGQAAKSGVEWGQEVEAVFYSFQTKKVPESAY